MEKKNDKKNNVCLRKYLFDESNEGKEAGSCMKCGSAFFTIKGKVRSKGMKKNSLKKAVIFATACACMVTSLSFGPSLVKADDATVTTTASSEETTVATEGRTVPHYDLRTDGGTWDGTHYYLADGSLATDIFFCDGTYTYYLQADGTPMTNRLTYHPDGVHVIYFDEKGHEAFDEFKYCKDVGYVCYFGTYGYAYFNEFTYALIDDTVKAPEVDYTLPNGKASDDITLIGEPHCNLVYIDETGRLVRDGWFTYSDGATGYIFAYYVHTTNGISRLGSDTRHSYCFINARLVRNSWVTDNRVKYYVDANGMVATHSCPGGYALDAYSLADGHKLTDNECDTLRSQSGDGTIYMMN